MQTLSDSFRCGFVSVIGRPNVGKSTLINSILNTKVSIVSHKPQTTRHRILGISSTKEHQIIFVDTPGLHQNINSIINKIMNKTAVTAILETDLILFMYEANFWTDEDQNVLKKLQNINVPVIALINKIDKIHPKEKLLEIIANSSKRYSYKEVIPICAKRRSSLGKLIKVIPPLLPVSPPIYSSKVKTDRDESFQIAELIREKLIIYLQQEVPYGLTVQIEGYEKNKKGCSINAIIWVEKDSHKGIVIGKNGAMLKKIGTEARIEIKEKLTIPVYLEMWVKVKKHWVDNNQDLINLGYNIE